MKDYSDDDDGPDERKFSEEELGKSVLEDGDEIMYDDEKCDIEILSDEPAEDEDDLGLDEEVFVYDENENYDE